MPMLDVCSENAANISGQHDKDLSHDCLFFADLCISLLCGFEEYKQS
jgi:hypothetical protein